MNPAALHPMIVHFPIALLTIGALASVAAKIFSKKPFGEQLYIFASYSVIVGAASALVAILSGYLFTNEMVGIMGEIRDTHIKLAFASVVFGCVSAVLMLFGLCANGKCQPLMRNLATGSSLLTATVIGLTGHYGGMMVFGL